MSKACSRGSRYAISFLTGVALSACAVVPQSRTLPSSPSSSSSQPTVLKRNRVPPSQEDSPRAVASLRLTEQARVLLESGKVDDAISTLERAINLNPSNGRNYYYLAEAWLRKGNPSQAREFNRLAAIYLRDEPEWINRVDNQKERIKTR